ncbi:MAG: hypothetical protein WDO18_00450 [Acidobacteriota bacterium]
MKSFFWKLAATSAVSVGLIQAQGQQKGAPMPPPLACGVHGDAEVICGTRSPEDLEVTPDGKFLIVPQYANGPGGQGGGQGLTIFDPAKKTFMKLAAVAEPLKDWGDPTCPGPIGDTLGPHGTSLVKRSNGKIQLYVVNHGGPPVDRNVRTEEDGRFVGTRVAWLRGEHRRL